MQKQEAIWRTKHLITQLRRVKTRKNFDFDIDLFHDRTDCGTAACAAGLAGMLPAFNKKGFGLTDGGTPFYRRRGARTELGVDALCKFLDVSSDVHKFIFYRQGYDVTPTAAEVADRMENEILPELEARRR